MWIPAAALVISATVAVGCSDRHGTPRTLKSGEEIQLLFAGVVGDSFYVEYCSELPFTDRRALGVEADEILDALRADLTQSGQSEAQVWPTVCRLQVRWAGWVPVIIREESTSFAYSPAEGGAWTRLN